MDKCKYQFTNYRYNRKLSADNMFDKRIMYQFNRRVRPKPKIAYIKFESSGFSMECGQRVCVQPTTPVPANTTVGPTTTRATLPPLNGSTCDAFIKRQRNTGPGQAKGVLRISVPVRMRNWYLKVSLFIH